MKEIFDKFEHIGFDKKNLILFDTCFIIDMFARSKTKELKGIEFSMTSFNVLELIHVAHHLEHNLKHSIRKFFSQNSITILDVPVQPGDMKKEKEFVNSIDLKILRYIADPSDAVLLGAAIKTHSVVLTKDKHHLFTTKLENFLNNYDIKVYKELKDIL